MSLHFLKGCPSPSRIEESWYCKQASYLLQGYPFHCLALNEGIICSLGQNLRERGRDYRKEKRETREGGCIYTTCSFYYFIILLLYWGYIVTFIKVLTIYHS
jgi:hypothetical protein